MIEGNAVRDVVLTVTDLKQWIYCPRVVYYQRCLPNVRPTTFRMEAAHDAHADEEDRERRRSLRTYGLVDGERAFGLEIISRLLPLRGKIDLVVRRADEVIPVDYKDSEGRVGRQMVLQLAAYGLLLEEATGLPARRGFLYFIPMRRSREVRLGDELKDEVRATVGAVQAMIAGEVMPPPTPWRQRCVHCEFRRFCNDVI